MTQLRRPLIAGNWKMNGLVADATSLANSLTALTKKNDLKCEMLVCPPAMTIHIVGAIIKTSAIELGAQDCHAATSGAHTGDISAKMIKDAGCSYVILGHSERRADHGESDKDVKAKTEAALKAGLKVIICIGETENERDQGKALDVVCSQLTHSMPDAINADQLVVAYEPVWAIGTGRIPSLDDVEEVHSALRKKLEQISNADTASRMRILYGGSMKPGNAKTLLALENVDGGLIGGASLKAEDFIAIANCC